MKKSIVFSLLMLATVFVFAQKGGGDQETRIQKKVDRMTEQLNLSADQQVQVKDLLLNQQKSRKATRGKKGEMSETVKIEKKEKHIAAKAEYDSKLAAILTPEQNVTFQELKKNNMRKGKGEKVYKGNKKGKSGANRKTAEEKTQKKVAKLTKELGLSETQQVQITEIMASKPQGKKRKGNKEMEEEERAAMKIERKAAKETYNAKLEQTLTPEQLAIYKANRSEKKAKKNELKLDKRKTNR